MLHAHYGYTLTSYVLRGAVRDSRASPSGIKGEDTAQGSLGTLQCKGTACGKLTSEREFFSGPKMGPTAQCVYFVALGACSSGQWIGLQGVCVWCTKLLPAHARAPGTPPRAVTRVVVTTVAIGRWRCIHVTSASLFTENSCCSQS